jgi:hypothetical protein
MRRKNNAALAETREPRHHVAGDVVGTQTVDDDKKLCAARRLRVSRDGRIHLEEDDEHNGGKHHEPSKLLHGYSLDDPYRGQKTNDIDAMATASGTLEALGTSIMFVRILPHPIETPGIGPQSTSDTPVSGWL